MNLLAGIPHLCNSLGDLVITGVKTKAKCNVVFKMDSFKRISTWKPPILGIILKFATATEIGSTVHENTGL